MRKSAVLLSLAAVAATALLSVAAQGPAPARVAVTVPEDAKVYFGDYLTKQTGTQRNFSTPPLEAGNYTYQLKAEVTRNGQLVSQTKSVVVRAGETSSVDFSALGAAPPDDGDDGPPPDAWPRRVEKDGNSVTIYQPQVETFAGNQLTARAAVAIELKASPVPTYGVVWLSARTDVDREQRTVTLDDIKITKVSFPTLPEKEDLYRKGIESLIPAGARTVSLDRILGNLAVTRAEAKAKDAPFKTDAPRVLFSTRPAVLVLIDGKPALRQVEGSKLLRVINTRALILLDQDSGKYFLHFADRWMQAKDAEGPYSVAVEPPVALDAARRQFADSPLVDLFDDPAPDLKEAMENGIMPTVYVSTVPAELLETEGEPDLAPIDGTKLLYVKNTSDQILMDTTSDQYYALLSGRWYRAKSLKEGPWEFVPGDKLPADLARIPSTHPKGDVLASVPGTPQAREALIANSIPQTAVVSRSDAKFEPVYDGDPDFEPIEGTELHYAANSPTPIVRVSPKEYYAVENGVWFTAPSPAGPWAVATNVPEAVYTIPPSSPIYYATNVYVYSSTPDSVYVGYTPGYFGVYPWAGTVVYGTGWYYRPWLRNAWYGRPWTYGYGVGMRWSPAGGWGFGAAAAVGRPWWGPVGWNASWGRVNNVWRPGWNAGWGGVYRGVHASNVHLNNVNVYNRWANNIVRPAVRPQVSVRPGGPVVRPAGGLNNVVAGAGGEVFRRDVAGWQQAAPKVNWSTLPAQAPQVQNLNREIQARQVRPAPAVNAAQRVGTGAIQSNPGGFRAPAVSMPRGHVGGGGRRR